ncbi:hypothetical protein HZS_7592 [Henneguya salminicola]|nr:hypothetical protein HZS_7592 [Henneguya salminicola]
MITLKIVSFPSLKRSLKKLKTYINQISKQDLNQIMPAWVRIFLSFSQDENLDIKIVIHEINHEIIKFHKSIFEKYVDSIIVPWFLATREHDDIFKTAYASFCNYFQDDSFTLNTPAFLPYRDCIINHITSKLKAILSCSSSSKQKNNCLDINTRCCFYSASILMQRCSAISTINPLAELIFDPKFMTNVFKSSEYNPLAFLLYKNIICQVDLTCEYLTALTKFLISHFNKSACADEYKNILELIFFLVYHKPDIVIDLNICKNFWSKVWLQLSSIKNDHISITYKWALNLFNQCRIINKNYKFCFTTLINVCRFMDDLTEADVPIINSLNLLPPQLIHDLFCNCMYSCDPIDTKQLTEIFDKIFLNYYKYCLLLPIHRTTISTLFFDIVDSAKKSSLFVNEVQTLLRSFTLHFTKYIDFFREHSFSYSANENDIWTSFLDIYFSKPDSYYNVDEFLNITKDELYCLFNQTKSSAMLALFWKFSIRLMRSVIDKPKLSKTLNELINTIPSNIFECEPLYLSLKLLLETIPCQLDITSLLCQKLHKDLLLRLVDDISEDVSYNIENICIFLWDGLCNNQYNSDEIDEILEAITDIIIKNRENKKNLLEKITQKLTDPTTNSGILFKTLNLLNAGLTLDCIFTPYEMNVIFQKWFLTSVDSESMLSELTIKNNIMCACSALDGFLIQLYSSVNNSSKIQIFFSNFFQSPYFVDFLLTSYENFHMFISYFSLGIDYLRSSLKCFAANAYYFSEICSTMSFVPSYQEPSEFSSTDYDILLNKITFIYLLFSTESIFLKLINVFKDIFEFKEWVSDFLLLCIFHDSLRGIAILKDLINSKTSTFFTSLIQILVIPDCEHSYRCILLSHILRLPPFNSSEFSKNLLTEFLSEHPLSCLSYESNELASTNIVSTLMGSLKDPQHICLLFQFYNDTLVTKTSTRAQYHVFLGLCNSLIANFLYLPQIQTDQFLKARTELVSYIPFLSDIANKLMDESIVPIQSTSAAPISHLFLFSLLRRSVHFHQKLGVLLINEKVATKILNLANEFVDSNVCGFYYPLDILCLYEIELICAFLQSSNFDASNNHFSFSHVALNIHPYTDASNLFLPSYTHNIISLTQKLFFCFRHISHIPSQQILFLNIGMICNIPINDEPTINPTLIESLLIKISESSTICEGFIAFIQLKSYIASLNCDEFFDEIIEKGSTFYTCPFFSKFLASTHHTLTDFNTYRHIFNCKYYFVNKSLREETAKITSSLFIYTSFLQILLNVSPSKRANILRSSSIKQLLHSILLELFEKLPCVSNSFLEPRKIFKIGNIKSIGHFIFYTLMLIGTEFPFIFSEFAYKAGKKLSSSVKMFCNAYLCLPIINHQFDSCLRIFKDDPNINISIQRASNSIIANVLQTEDFSLPLLECSVCHKRCHKPCLVNYFFNFRINGLVQQVKNYAHFVDQIFINDY